MTNPTATPRTVTQPPAKPVLIWDGDCGFCKFWALRWAQWTRGRVEYLPYQDPARTERFPELPTSECETAVHYIEPDGRVSRAAEAVFRSLTHTRWWFWLLWLYQFLPGFKPVSELGYRFVAGHRPAFSWINRLLWGPDPEIPRHGNTVQLFIRAVGFIFLIAFFSLWVQVHGLVGEQGILPADQLMTNADQYFDQNDAGASRYISFPTLGWLAAGDTALSVYCILGIIGSALVVAGIFPTLSLLVCWILYLSLSRLGQDFLGFQWDALLLETGFLALLISPWRSGRLSPHTRHFSGRILLVRWLLFRLMLESGLVKLSSGDPTWRSLTALDYHFFTQPLPTWLGYYAHQLPELILKMSTALMFVVELLVPLLIFAPRRLRLLAMVPLVGLQGVILLTGNYGFFNWLTLVLCLSLLDDRALRSIQKLLGRMLRRGNRSSVANLPEQVATPRSRFTRVRTVCIGIYAALALVIGGLQLLASAGFRAAPPRAIAWINQQILPFSLINNYGLFAVMTRSRPEIIIEGSRDGINWQPYEFCYKPGAYDRPPGFILCHMPRLDWQMWFAALREGNPPLWLQSFCQRLFERSPAVIDLLERDPFVDEPPTYLRLLVYDYEFTASNAGSDDWWQAKNRRYYLPPMQYQAPDGGRN